MSAGLAAFARGLQSIDPIGREFIADLQTSKKVREGKAAMQEVETIGAAAEAAARGRQTEAKMRAEYIDQVGRYEALKAQYPDLEAMAQKDPVQYRSLLAVNKIDPDAGATFDQFKAKKIGGGTELPKDMQGRYLQAAERGPGGVDEAMLEGAMARANAAMRLGLDPKGYIDVASIARNVVADRGQMARSAWEGLTGAYKDVSGREFQAGEGEKERGFKSGENALDRAGRLAEIGARGREDRETNEQTMDYQKMKDLKAQDDALRAAETEAKKEWSTIIGRAVPLLKKGSEKELLRFLEMQGIPIEDVNGNPIKYEDAKGRKMFFGEQFRPSERLWTSQRYPELEKIRRDRSGVRDKMEGLSEGNPRANPNRIYPKFAVTDTSNSLTYIDPLNK